jgi:hypothetical protein
MNLHEPQITDALCGVPPAMLEETANGGPLAAPTATHSLTKPTNDQKCFCFWPNCKELHFEAIQNLPSNHPWCQPILQVVCGNTNRTLALRHCIAHHENPGNFASLKKITDGVFPRKLQRALKEASKFFQGSFDELRRKLRRKLGANFKVFEFLSSDIKMTHNLQSHLMRKIETSQQCCSFSFTKHNVQ